MKTVRYLGVFMIEYESNGLTDLNIDVLKNSKTSFLLFC